MIENIARPKLKQLQNFLTNPNSDESKNYVNDILSAGTNRPEDLFVQKFLNPDFWQEMGFSDKEIKIEYPAGQTGRVEITLVVEDQIIAIECKKPFLVKGGKVEKHELDGDDIHELKDQISDYLLSHSFVIFTNGFHWFFYSRESYSIWDDKKDKNDLHPYFDHLTSDEIFSQESQNNILNILQRQNILESLSGMGGRSIRHFLTDEFFTDLKTWVGFIDDALKNTPSDVKARTTTLVNKLIFVRTMEGVGIIPNGFLERLWDNKKGVRNSTVDFIDHIDDELTETYDTELFTSKYIVNEDGNPMLIDGLPQFSKERQRNYAYKALPEDFFSAILRNPKLLSLKDSGKMKVIFNNKEYFLRSLYWWRFESIPADILGKAYETYLARERKKLGIFYTPHQMTNFLTSSTVNILFDEKYNQLKNELEKNNWEFEKIKLLGNQIREIKICDPSCGSGSFLIVAIRIIWYQYKRFEKLIQTIDKQFDDGKAVLDHHLTEKAGAIRYLESLFRIKDKQQRMGTLILRHIYGNDKDVKAVDTAKLNIWLECLRLDPNSYRKDSLKGKRHALPNLELNITWGDSLVGLPDEVIENTLKEHNKAIKSIFDLRDMYVESFDKNSLVKNAAIMRRGLEDPIDHEFAQSIGIKFNQELIKILQPTHWALQHWEAFYDKNGEPKPKDQQGFDAIVGNPPWEILKPNIDEFFSPLHNSDDLAKFRMLTKDEKNKFVEKMLKSQVNVLQYDDYKYRINLQKKYYGTTKLYLHQSTKSSTARNVIDINFYKLFLEKYHSLLKKGGIGGVVLPASFLLDLGSKGLRDLILNDSKILSIYEFENKKGIFEEIHRQYRFITLLFKKGEKTTSFKSAFHLRDIEKLTSLDSEAFDYKVDLIKKMSPNSLAILECRSQLEVDILEKLFKFPHLFEEKDDGWNIKLQREFDMTDDSYLFNTEGKGSILYEGKMIHQFDHLYKEPRYWIETDKGEESLRGKQVNRIKRDNKINSDKISEVRIDSEYYRIAWRDVTNAVDFRTLIATILPPSTFLGRTLNYLKPIYFDGKQFQKSLTSKQMLYLLGMFNSLVIDFIMRHRVTLHATMFIMYELPIPRLKQDDRFFPEIVDIVGKLVCTTTEFNELKNEVGIENAESEPSKREDLIARLNAYVAKIYGLKKEELEYILGTFRLVTDSLKSKTLEEFSKL